MNPKIFVFFDEFPFLKERFDPRLFGSATVSRVDMDLLGSKWHGGYYEYRVEFFTETGELLGAFKEAHRLRDIFKDSPPSTFGGLMATLGDEELFYVVQARGFRRSPNWDLVVYKPPKGFTLRGWLDELYQRGQKEIRAAVAGIDAEGTPA